MPETFPRGLSYNESFSQTFHAGPGGEWRSSVAGAGQFTWDSGGYLKTALVNNSGSQVDEYYRTQDVPTVTEAHDFAFSGRFRISSNTFGGDRRNGMVFGWGNSALASGSFRQGIGVHVESTPTGNTVKVTARLGNPLEELSGNTVSIDGGVPYEVYVKHFITTDGWVISAEVYDEDGSLVGLSKALDSTGLSFSVDRIYLANDATLTDGGSLGIEWLHIGIEKEIVPVFNTKEYQARVRVDPNDLLQICGYRFHSAPLRISLAQGRRVSQSSDSGGGPAALAVDGDFNTFTHTGYADPAPWWEVDLGAEVPIAEIVVHNRRDCCEDLLRDITVTILNGVKTVTAYDSGLLNPQNAWGAPPRLVLDIQGTMGEAVVGRFVHVARRLDPAAPPEEHLSLGEVEVFRRHEDGGDSRVVVVYQRVKDTTHPATSPPLDALTGKTVESGTLKVVSAQGLPNSIVVHVPSILASGRSYALWVGSPDRGWSQTMLVNDARPSWISPDRAYTLEKIKIVGRNLDPDPAVGVTRVRLTGPSRYILEAENDQDPSTGIETYAAQVTLPSDMKPGDYSIEVCRDGVSWVPLIKSQTLTVLPVPLPPPRFDATAYGAVPDDGLEDTAAIQAAIGAAANAGGGEVYLPAGTYHVREIDLARGVSLTGAGRNATRLSDFHNDAFVEGGRNINLWSTIAARGHQTIRDLELFDPLGGVRVNSQSWAISLGKLGQGGVPPSDEVTITRCKFTGHTVGITSVWVPPLKRCTIVYNEFMTTEVALGLSGDGRPSYSKISHNIFYPSTAGWNYPSELGGGEYVEFSDNTLDGTVNGGWRNGFFWDLGRSNELVLISGNTLTATGDKGTGYGEGIAFDSNNDRVAYDGKCAGATSKTVTIPAQISLSWEEPISSLWVRIVDGKGVGQSRRIVGQSGGELNRLELSEPWDVLPDQTSWLIVTRLYWNVFVVDNLVDNRVALTNNQAGVLQLAGSSSDCVIDSNEQYDSEGINLWGGRVPGQYVVSYFNEIRNNLIDGEYNPPDERGGIFLWYGVQEGWPAPVLGYGAVIKDNTIIRSDCNLGPVGGAITIIYSWNRPSTPYTWKEPLIFGNQIADVDYGVFLVEPFAWNTVLFNNRTTNVISPLVDRGTNTVNVDTDMDGVADYEDNCPSYIYNPDQADADQDGRGDACTPVAMPVITPPGGTVVGPVMVRMTNGTEGAYIRYTLNGSNPTESSSLYTGPVTLSTAGTVTVKARGFKAGMPPSEVASQIYTIRINRAPVVRVRPVAAVTMPNAASLDGTVTDDGLPDPPGRFTVQWSQVSGPGTVAFADAASVDTTATFTAAGSYTLQLTAEDGALTGQAQVTVTVNPQPQVATPTITPNGGRHDERVRVSLATATSGATIRYTLDGSDPTATTGIVYKGSPFELVEDATVRAGAFKAGLSNSGIAQAVFDINQRPVVNAGADLSVTLPGTASLDGTVTDDEIVRVAVTWSKISGPGTVTFANASLVNTTATFSAAGSYTLRLAAVDGSMTVSDDLVVRVNPPVLRGDANRDGVVDVSDAIRILLHLFSGMTLASPEPADVNADGRVDMSDSIYLLAFLFRNGPAPLP